jgi:hypothetical protein
LTGTGPSCERIRGGASSKIGGTTRFSSAVSVSVLTLLAAVAPAQAKKCSVDSVQVGGLCVDKYEASLGDPGHQRERHREHTGERSADVPSRMRQ